MNHPKFISTLSLVTIREFKRAFLTRATLISIATVSLVMFAMLIIPQLMNNESAEKNIAVTGISSSEFKQLEEAAKGTEAHLSHVSTSDLPIDADAIWSFQPENGESQLITRKSSQQGEIKNIVDSVRLNGFDATQNSSIFSDFSISSKENDENQAQILVMAYFVVIVGFNLVVGNSSIVAQRCIEEKGNRVIDVLIPRFNLHGFLAGKVCGTGLAGVAQLVVLGLIAAILLALTGNSHWIDLVLKVLPHAIIWYVLGYLFFGFLHAGLGSLLRSPVEGAALQAPLQLLNLGLFVVAIFGLQNPNADWVHRLVAVPPFSLVLGPIVSVTAGWNSMLTVALILTSIFIIILSFIGVRLYRWGIVNDDWRKLFIRKGKINTRE